MIPYSKVITGKNIPGLKKQWKIDFFNETLPSLNKPGLNLSWQFLTSPCLQAVPAPHLSFTKMLSRTGLKIEQKHGYNNYNKIYLQSSLIALFK